MWPLVVVTFLCSTQLTVRPAFCYNGFVVFHKLITAMNSGLCIGSFSCFAVATRVRS
jgi:hypothetical protein